MLFALNPLRVSEEQRLWGYLLKKLSYVKDYYLIKGYYPLGLCLAASLSPRGCVLVLATRAGIIRLTC